MNITYILKCVSTLQMFGQTNYDRHKLDRVGFDGPDTKKDTGQIGSTE